LLFILSTLAGDQGKELIAVKKALPEKRGETGRRGGGGINTRREKCHKAVWKSRKKSTQLPWKKRTAAQVNSVAENV